jgi:peptide/nickel transport system substrate-binding protein
MGGWSASAAETMLFFQSWLVTTDAAKGQGTSNYGGWSNPGFDALANRAFTTMDPAVRADLLRQAGRIALGEMPVIPVHFEGASWATRRAIRYAGPRGRDDPRGRYPTRELMRSIRSVRRRGTAR